MNDDNYQALGRFVLGCIIIATIITIAFIYNLFETYRWGECTKTNSPAFCSSIGLSRGL
jgi:hypothetical protein